MNVQIQLDGTYLNRGNFILLFAGCLLLFPPSNCDRNFKKFNKDALVGLLSILEKSISRKEKHASALYSAPA
jgi:hypothetical protein